MFSAEYRITTKFQDVVRIKVTDGDSQVCMAVESAGKSVSNGKATIWLSVKDAEDLERALGEIRLGEVWVGDNQ